MFTIKFNLFSLFDYYRRYSIKYFIIIILLLRFKKIKKFYKILLSIFYRSYSNFELI